jgi:excinuclease ABC subunit C
MKAKYNTAQKDDKSYFVLVVTEEDFPRVVLVRYKDIDKENNLVLKSKFLGNIKKEIVKIKKTFGPYPSGIFAKDSLKLIRRIFPFRDKCIPYDKKQPYKKNPCFSYQIGLCPGVCAGVCDKKKYAKQIEHLLEFLEGNGEKVRADLEKEMHVFSKELKFEEAQKIRDTLFALDHIRDAHLIRKDVNEKEIRIEAYDVAHMSGENRVGAMTVFQNGVLAKHEYKKFKLSKDKNDDLEGLRELLERRFKHLEWKLPDVLVVDGDERHIKVAEEVLQSFKDEKTGEKNEEENALTLLKSIEVVAVTKGKNHKASRLTGKNDILDEYKESIVLLNHEAHRFSINYHKLLRKKKFVG